MISAAIAVARQHGAGEAGLTMAERRHPIEQMRRLPRARVDRRARLRQRRARMPERHTTAARHEVRDQIERALQFGRERDDADAVAGGVDLGNDVAAMEIARTYAPRTRSHPLHLSHLAHPAGFGGMRPAAHRESLD